MTFTLENYCGLYCVCYPGGDVVKVWDREEFTPRKLENYRKKRQKNYNSPVTINDNRSANND